MAYATGNPKTKKIFKELATQRRVRLFQPGLGPDLTNFTGRVSVEGPHYPAPHTWYADCDLVNGEIVKVR